MYGLVQNGSLTKWPITKADLQAAYPSTSLNNPFNMADYGNLGVVPITDLPQPDYDYRTHKVSINDPELVDGAWVRNWTVTALTAEEISAIDENQAVSMRQTRNAKLQLCDWTHLTDSALDEDAKSAWAVYRASLRAVPEQEGFPWSVTWPAEPA